jgi:class 3 adenylate cyclase
LVLRDGLGYPSDSLRVPHRFREYPERKDRMPDNPLSRKLTTIIALDVAVYPARTEADETRTAAEVAALRRLIEGIATAKGGRVFNTAGDGFMLEFGSSLAAVEAAFALAHECEPKGTGGPSVAMSWCSPTETFSATA